MATDFKPTRFNTTQEKIYIVETRSPFDRVEFQFMPVGMKVNRSAKFAAISPVGRNNDLYQYVGGNNTVQFEIDFFSDDENRKDVIQKCNFLQSLAMKDGGFGPAPKVNIVMGEIFRGMTWIVNRVNVSYDNYDPNYNFMPVRAKVKVQMTLDTNRNLTVRDVRNQI